MGDRVAAVIASLLGGLRALVRRNRVERELDEELRGFLEASAEARRGAGASEEAARRAARVEMGALDAAKEEVRSVGWESAVETIVRDGRFAVRTLSRSPAFTVVAVLTLALGIGVNTAFLGAAHSVLVRPLPYPHAKRLMHIWAYWPGGLGNMAYPDYAALRERARTFESVAACESWGSVALTGNARPRQLRTSFVTPNYLSLLGAEAAVGRLFREDDNVAEGAHPVAVLSHDLWQREFAGDPGVAGQVIRLDRRPFTIVGVLKPGFHGLGEVDDPPEPDVWLPTAMAHELLGQPSLADQGYSIYWSLGLLRPGVTLEQARQDLAGVARQLEREQPATHRGRGLDLQPVSRYANGQMRRPLYLLVAGAALVLLIGCVNIASSLLARLASRKREMALRSALGASTAQLVRQLVVECAVLAAAGGAAGIALAVAATGVLGGWVRQNTNPLVNVRADGWMAAFAAVLALATMVVMAVLPAWQVRDLRSSDVAAQGGRLVSGGPRRLRRTLVVAEVAFSIVLLVGAGLMLRSFQELATSGLGFRTDHLLTFRLSLTGGAYAAAADRGRFTEALVDRLGEVPGVESVSLLGPAMLGRATWIMNVFPRERTPRGPEDFVVVFRHSVNPGALGNLGIPILRGRDFSRFDAEGSPPVAIVSQSVAAQLWPGENALGRQLRQSDPTRAAITIVGVAADARHRERYALGDIAADFPLGGLGPQRDVYLPYAQRANRDVTVAVRFRSGTAVAEGLAAAIASLDPDLPLADVHTLDDRLAEQIQAPAGIAILMGAYALLALFLAALGIYGVLAQSVVGRMREIGTRMALGAQRRDILGLVMREGLQLVAGGVAAGLLGAWSLTRLMTRLLYGVDAKDPLTFAAAVPVLAAVALLACFIPARRAVTLDPIQTLRCE